MRLSERLQQEADYVRLKLGSAPICSRCGATLVSFGDVCSAELDDACPGFTAIDSAKAEFNRGWNAKQK